MKTDYSPTIKDLPAEERPRERFYKLGPQALSNTELLAIIIQSGTHRETALDLSEKLMSWSGGLTELSKSSIEELTEIRGIGRVKAISLLAALELSKRFVTIESEVRPKITSPVDVANLIMQEMRFLDKEYFRIILLNTRSEILKMVNISVGSLDSSIVHPREVFKAALKSSAKAVILVHNHPSGNPQPSSEDIKITKRLIKVGELLGVQIIDHIIIGDKNYISLKEKKIIS